MTSVLVHAFRLTSVLVHGLKLVSVLVHCLILMFVLVRRLTLTSVLVHEPQHGICACARYLTALNVAYGRKYGDSLVRAVEKQFSNNVLGKGAKRIANKPGHHQTYVWMHSPLPLCLLDEGMRALRHSALLLCSIFMHLPTRCRAWGHSGILHLLLTQGMGAMILDRSDYYASELNKAIAGTGTDTDTLTRIVGIETKEVIIVKSFVIST
eukprot:1161736-Pelagomonas_calceolata.AAC.5